MFRQSDNVINNQNRNVLKEGCIYFQMEGGNYGRKGYSRHEIRGDKETEDNSVSDRQADTTIQMVILTSIQNLKHLFVGGVRKSDNL